MNELEKAARIAAEMKAANKSAEVAQARVEVVQQISAEAGIFYKGLIGGGIEPFYAMELTKGFVQVRLSESSRDPPKRTE